MRMVVFCCWGEDRLEDGAGGTLSASRKPWCWCARPDLEGREIVALRTPLLGAGIRVRPQRDIIPGAAAVISDAPEMVALDPARRAELMAQVAANTQMPEQVRSRILAQLEQDQVPAQLLDRLASRAAGGLGHGCGALAKGLSLSGFSSISPAIEQLRTFCWC
jgi:hypothetical protein